MDRWQRLQELFEKASALDPAEVPGFLAREEPDPGLRAEVMALLRADSSREGLTSLVGRVASGAELEGLEAGMLVGPWRLLEERGAGGMGTVFRAERADGAYERIVAIKFLRGPPSRDAAERMRRERQILANLDHPNIARLIDGGTTPGGVPYLVMDYVEGRPITEHARALTLDERLRLLATVARALQFAHQHLVIHRDLKPANILVRADGTPVLLDFGIAKLLEAGTEEDQSRTLAWFTPGYASPEQRLGAPVSTATDIYSLGQVMAEVLSGEFRQPRADGSVALPGERGLKGLPGQRLRELDAIVAQACAIDPAQRYRSAEALAEDIDRYFRHMPVRAAPARPGYLLRRFLRRHRIGVAMVAAFLLAMAAFTWRLAIERDRALQAEALAQSNAATAEQVVDYLVSLFKAASPEQAGNEPIMPAELVDRGLERLREQLDDQPRQRARLLSALGRIDMELGRMEQAVETLEEAVALDRQLGDREHLARDLSQLGFAMNILERSTEALGMFTEAIGLFDAVDNPEEKVSTMTGLALAHYRLGNGPEAWAVARECLQLAEQVLEPESERMVHALQAYAEVASSIGHGEEAVEAAGRALEILRRRHPDRVHEIAIAAGFLGGIHARLENHEEAIRLFREAIGLHLGIRSPDSDWLIMPRHNLAVSLYYVGRELEASAIFRENLDQMRARGLTGTPAFLITLTNLARLYATVGDHERALVLYEEYAGLVAGADADMASRNDDSMRLGHGEALIDVGRLEEARSLIWQEIPDLGTDENAIDRSQRLLLIAKWMRRSGRLDEVEPYLDQAEDELVRRFGQGYVRLAQVARARADLRLDQGRPHEAIPLLGQAIADLAAAWGEQTILVVDARVKLLRALVDSGRLDEARELLAGGFDGLEQRVLPQGPMMQELMRLRARLRR